MPVVNVEQLKSSVNRMSVDIVRDAVNELRLDGLVTEGKTPFNKVHFNTCWEAVDVLRWLKEFTEAASASPVLRAELVKA